MENKNLHEYKKKYSIAKHHAWAGSLFLAILLAIRAFFEISNINFDDRIILFIGAIIVIYMIIALFFTFKYRVGLTADGNHVELEILSDNKDKEKVNYKIEKEKMKIEKKRAKSDIKKIKKNKK